MLMLYLNDPKITPFTICRPSAASIYLEYQSPPPRDKPLIIALSRQQAGDVIFVLNNLTNLKMRSEKGEGVGNVCNILGLTNTSITKAC